MFVLMYRPQRGGLEESMAEARAIYGIEDLARRVGVPSEKIQFFYLGFDARNGWDTYMVSAAGQAVGFTNGEL